MSWSWSPSRHTSTTSIIRGRKMPAPSTDWTSSKSSTRCESLPMTSETDSCSLSPASSSVDLAWTSPTTRAPSVALDRSTSAESASCHSLHRQGHFAWLQLQPLPLNPDDVLFVAIHFLWLALYEGLVDLGHAQREHRAPNRTTCRCRCRLATDVGKSTAAMMLLFGGSSSLCKL